MFNDKSQSNNQTASTLNDLNKDKEFPFEKADDSPDTLEDKKITGTKGPVEDILATAESDNKSGLNGLHADKTDENKNFVTDVKKEAGLKEVPVVPAMTQPSMERSTAPAPAAAAPAPPSEPEVQSSPPMPEALEVETKRPNKIFMIILGVFIVVILGLAGVFAYQYFTQEDDSSPAEQKNVNESLQGLLNIINQQQPPDQDEDQETDEQEEYYYEDEYYYDEDEYYDEYYYDEDYYLDSDNDGLTDEDEIDLGTNPNQIDTDEDGLSDFEEVEIYQTDPVKPDTDGDGYEDGNEVENGYDPLRAGSARL